MALTLDPALEQRIQQELAASQFREPEALLAHALDLVAAEREDLAANQLSNTAAEDWLDRNREAINRDLEESFASAERGEGYSPEEARVLLAERRAARAA